VAEEDYPSLRQISIALEEKLKSHPDLNVVVDGCNTTISSRRNIVRIARKVGVWQVSAIFVDTPKEVCKERVQGQGGSRKKQMELIDRLDEELQRDGVPPSVDKEGWNKVAVVANNQALAQAIELVCNEEAEEKEEKEGS